MIFDVATITAVSTAVVLIIAAHAQAVSRIISAVKAAKGVAEETKAINQVQSGKLDNITQLVDGQYSAVLKELAEVKRVLADVTGRRSDRDGADAAERASNAHAARVNAASKKEL